MGPYGGLSTPVGNREPRHDGGCSCKIPASDEIRAALRWEGTTSSAAAVAVLVGIIASWLACGVISSAMGARRGRSASG